MDIESVPDRFVRDDHPATRGVLNWTYERDIADIKQMLEWLQHARTSTDRRALLDQINGLLREITHIIELISKGE